MLALAFIVRLWLSSSELRGPWDAAVPKVAVD